MILNIGTKINLFFGMILIVITIGALVTYNSLSKLVDTAQQAGFLQHINYDLENLNSKVKDSETSRRGYMITGENKYLQTNQTANQAIQDMLNDLKNDFKEQPIQKPRLSLLEQLISQKLAIHQKSITQYQLNPNDSQTQHSLTNEGNALMDEIRISIKLMQSETIQELGAKNETVFALARNTLSIITFGLIFTFGITVTSALLIHHDVKIRKEAGIALRKSESKFRRIFESNMIGIGYLTADRVITHANQALLDILGYSKEDIQSGQIKRGNLTPPEFAHLDQQALQEVNLRGMCQPYEKQIIRKDGQRVDILGAAAAFEDSPDQGVFFVLDISKEKQAERALQQSLADQRRLADLLLSIINSLPVNLALLDREGTIISINDNWKKFAQNNGWFDPDFGVGLNYLEICRNCSNEQAKEGSLVAFGIEQVLHNQLDQFTREYDCHSPQEERWFQMIVSPVYQNPDHRLDGAVVMHINVTDRKQADNALRQAEEKYRSIFENAIDGIYQTNTDGYFTMVNSQMAKILGYDTPTELIVNVPHINDLKWVQKEVTGQIRFNLIETGLVRNLEAQLIRKNGSKIWVSYTRHAIQHQKDKDKVYYEGSLQDITQRKELEEQLRQSQKMEAIGRLAGGVAHDFNNLLTAILGYSQLGLKQYQPGEKIHHFLVEIIKAGESASSLTRQLLALSRKQTTQPVKLNLNAVIKETEKILKRLIGEDIELVIKLDSTLKNIKADPGQIQQILINLIVNARDAMPKGGTIIIETSNMMWKPKFGQFQTPSQIEQYVMLVIQDTGCGMSSEVQEHIFEPFFTTKDQNKGTGLGLSTVYGIVSQNGGFIEVQSELEKGTTFQIYFPQTLENESLMTSIPSQYNQLVPGTEVILLVEDEEMVLEFAKDVLSSAGYEVIVARNGEEGLKLVEKVGKFIQLVLSDIGLPKMNGYILAKQAKDLYPHLKILLMTGYQEPEVKKITGAFQMYSTLEKPFNPYKLLSKVRTLLDQKELP